MEGVAQDPQNDSPKSSNAEIKPDDTTMDKAPELPESMDNNNEKTTKDSLAEALDSVVTMDAVTEVPGESDDDAHHKWEKNEIDKRVPTLPKSLGGEEKTDGNGLVYLEYTFTVDPEKYRSANYQPIANAADAQGGSEPNLVTKEQLFSSVSNDKVDEEVKVEEKVEEKEPTAKEEKEAAVEANEEKAEHDSLGKPIEEKGGVKEQTEEEKEAEDEAIAKGLIDFATFIDGSSFLCNDEVSGIDYSKIAMDAGPKKAPTKQNCKTTFAQCRAKNPLFCRFHGPKLLEKDIKTAISAALGKGCVVSVTKDKGNKNPLAFRLTVGCPPQMKKDVEQTIHWYMTNVPGISSPEEYKDLGNGKETTEFEMDVLKADEPPKKSETKAQVAEYEVEKATAGNKKMAVVGETPPSIEKKAANAEVSHKFGEEPKVEKLANEGGVQKTEEQPPAEAVEEKVDETEGGNVGHKSKQFEILQKTNPMLDSYHTGIHSVEDIKTFEEALDYEAPTYPDITQKLIDKAKSNGKIKVYSSKPIENGAFVSPSEMCAKDYAGDGEVYSKVLPLADIAWISGDEGQVAIVGGEEQDMQQANPNVDDNLKFSQLVDEAMNKGLFDIPEFKKGYDSINWDHTTYPTTASQIDALEKLMNETDWESKKPQPMAEEKAKKEFEDEFNAALGEYPENGSNIDNDAKNIEINEAFTKAYLAHDEEGMKSAIEAMKKLVADVKGEEGGEGGSDAGENKGSDFHYVDDAAMKMTGEIDDLAHENPELISGDDNVSALYYGAQQAINGLDLYKQGLEEIDAKIKAMGDDDFEMGASGIIEKKTLELAKMQQQDYYDEAKAHAEISVKDFKAAVETAKNNIVDGIKGIQAGNVEDIVKTTAMSIFPNGKPDEVDTVVDMIDAMYEGLGNFAMKHFEETVEGADKYSGLKEKYLVGQKYNAVSAASLEFDAAVKNFKTEIDNAKDEASAKGLRSAVKEIGDKATALKDAFFVYKAAVDATKKDIETSAAVEAAKKKLTNGKGKKDLSELLDNPNKLGYGVEFLAHEAVSKYKNEFSNHDGFLFKWSVDDGNNLIIQMKNIKKDEDGFTKAMSVESVENLKNSMNEVFGKHGLQVAYNGLPKAMANLGKISFKVEAAKKKLSQNSGNDQPSQDEILDAAKKHALSMSSSDVDGSTKYYANEISKVISGEGYPKSVDKELPNIGSRRDMAKHYLHMLKDLDGVSPSVIAALQKVVDMPKWGEKKLKSSSGGTSGAGNMGGSTKQSIKALKKKLAQDPSNADLQKKLKVYEKKLEELSKDDD